MKVTIAHKKRAYPVHSKSTWRGCTIWRVMGSLRDRLATVVQIYCIHMWPTYVACICTCVHIHCVYPVRAHPYSVCVRARACACITTRTAASACCMFITYTHMCVCMYGDVHWCMSVSGMSPCTVSAHICIHSQLHDTHTHTHSASASARTHTH
jgi:hypothetical protein